MKSTVEMIRDRLAKAEAKGDEKKAQKLRDKIAKVEERERKLHGGLTTEEHKAAKSERKAEIKNDVVPDDFRDRYDIEVRENIATSGNHSLGFRNSSFKYRFVVTDKHAHGRPVKVGYAYTYMTAYSLAEKHITRLYVQGA